MYVSDFTRTTFSMIESEFSHLIKSSTFFDFYALNLAQSFAILPFDAKVMSSELVHLCDIEMQMPV